MTRNNKRMNQTVQSVTFKDDKSNERKDNKSINIKSSLTEEVSRIPLCHLRRLFKGKLSEYNQFKYQNRIGEFNSNTIFRSDISDHYKHKLEEEQKQLEEELERKEQLRLQKLQGTQNDNDDLDDNEKGAAPVSIPKLP